MCVAIHNMSSMNEFFLANPIILRCGLDRDYSVYVLGETRFSFFFFLFLCTRFSWGTKVTVHTVRLLFKHCFVLFTHFSVTFLLKMGSMILFTHLKIILLQCFQFSAKISCIQTDPLWKVLFVILLWFSLGVINIWTTTKYEIYLVDPHHIVWRNV